MWLFHNGQARVAGILLVIALGYLWEASSMPRGTPSMPGPALFPIAVGTLITLLSLTLLFQLSREKGGEEMRVLPAGERGKRVVGLWLALGAYAVLVTTLGHMLLTGLVSVVILRLLGMRHWWSIVLLAVGLAVGSYYLFAVLF